MYTYEIYFRDKLLCKSEESYQVKGMASAIARNTVYRIEQEFKRVKYKYEISEFRDVVKCKGESVYDVYL